MDDATTFLVHTISEHLDTSGNYVRVLFVDFSSAFNTMMLSKLIDKLMHMAEASSLCMWILDYLHGLTQQVRIGDTLSQSPPILVHHKAVYFHLFCSPCILTVTGGLNHPHLSSNMLVMLQQ